MITTLILLGILTVFIIGFVQVYNRHSRVVEKIDFAGEYRNKFIEFSKKYFQTYDRYSRAGNFDGEFYVWLTMNVNKIQSNLGTFGVMEYIAPFQTYRVSNYQIVINTIPKFRDGSIKEFDIHSVDDCLLRYIGYLEEYSKDTQKKLKNPIVWFREGFRELLSVPIFILSWFGIISNRTVNSIKNSLIYKVVSGLIALVTLVSGVVTIIVGYDQTIELVNKILRK
ncbi:hypothetical protein [uncultured Chryseobacterium sp.]|jgi:hypothetical protein|uniref:hypothetical protein n=1 Tax=uncultured Chryseobacterium sp. TaxID=259322 RepID=UPI002633A038|nr:hypothetical protein [uncultured Chryseobacterium sp.]